MPRHSISKSSVRFLWCVAFICGTLCAPSTKGQELYARIQGLVTDQSGASVPGVVITAMETKTGVSAQVTSKSDGSYEFLQLSIGDYSVSAKKSGFKELSITGIVLTVNQVYVQNFKLELGEVAERVTVQAETMQVETTSMQLSTIVSSSNVEQMPLNGRNWTQLQQLQPGVVASATHVGTVFATNGNQEGMNSFLINGTDSNDVEMNTPLIIPSPDAIVEFQMVTSTINPEFARSSGAIINAAIKSGTNEFHGDAFDFFRDTGLNGRDFFQNAPSIFHQNQFGATLRRSRSQGPYLFLFLVPRQTLPASIPLLFGSTYT